MDKQLINNGRTKVKLLCSYGGKIHSRPSDHQLSYVGGDTKILAVDRRVRFADIAAKLRSLWHTIEASEISVKYQLPGEGLDALVSLIDDDDVEHMMVEYDRMQRIPATKPARLRLFVFDISPVKPGVQESGPVTPSNPDYLFGFDKEYQPSIGPPLDLLQIPGMVSPENCGFFPIEGKMGITESQVNNSVNGAAADEAAYRVPVMVNGRVYFPVMQSEQRMMGLTGNSLERKFNQRNYWLIITNWIEFSVEIRE